MTAGAPPQLASATTSPSALLSWVSEFDDVGRIEDGTNRPRPCSRDW
jgi:hypothetical protein